MLDLTGASSKCAEQRDSNHELRALAEGGCTGVKKYAVNTKKKKKIAYKSVFACRQFCLPVCLSVQCSDWEHIASRCSFNTRAHMHISLNIHGEHPRLQWVTPGYASSLLPLLPGSHTGGIWNLLAAESHRAIKPSKAHKRTRGRTSNNVGPTSCQQTQCILNLNKPHCSFFILPVSLYVSLNSFFFSLSLTNTTWEWSRRENFYIFTPKWNWYWCWGELNAARATETVEKQILMRPETCCQNSL